MRARLNLDPAQWGVQALAEIGVAVALAACLGSCACSYAARRLCEPRDTPDHLRGRAPRRRARRAAGLLYGLLQLVLPGAFVYQPVQAALDYPLAFMALGSRRIRRRARLAHARGGRLRWRCAARFCFHFLSGLIFFASYAPQWENSWLYSATYNLLYLVPEGVLTTLLLWPLLKAYDAAFPGRGRGAP